MKNIYNVAAIVNIMNIDERLLIFSMSSFWQCFFTWVFLRCCCSSFFQYWVTRRVFITRFICWSIHFEFDDATQRTIKWETITILCKILSHTLKKLSSTALLLITDKTNFATLNKWWNLPRDISRIFIW